MRDLRHLAGHRIQLPAYSQFLPEFGQARAVQIDIDPSMVALRYPLSRSTTSSATRGASTLRELLPPAETEEVPQVAGGHRIERLALVGGDAAAGRGGTPTPINPEYVVHALDAQLPGDVIRDRRLRVVRQLVRTPSAVPRGHMRGSLFPELWPPWDPGVPYAIGAKFAHPDRPVIALVGDGAMQDERSSAELITAAKYWQEWSNTRGSSSRC